MDEVHPDVLEDLRRSGKLRPLLGPGPVRLWEAFAFAFHERDLARLALEGPLPSEAPERFRRLREALDPLVEPLRRFLPSPPRELDELILAFISVSPAARDSAKEWLADPDARRADAEAKLRSIEDIVRGYHLALTPAPAPAVPPIEPVPALPPAPEGLNVVASSGQVLLQWAAAPGADYYRVKRATDRRGPYKTVANVPKPQHHDADLVDGTTYHYVVHAVNRGGPGPHSARVSATPAPPPPAPSGLVALPGDLRVTLTWLPVPGATSYSLRRSDRPGGPYGTILRTPRTTAVDERVANGRAYFYVVRAAVGAVKGAFSAEASATPGLLPEKAGSSTDAIPTLESIAMPSSEQMQGIDFDKLMDLRRAIQLRDALAGTERAFEVWEALAATAEGPAAAKGLLDDLIRLHRKRQDDAFAQKAAPLLDGIAKLRAASGDTVKRLRGFLAELEVSPPGPEALEIALGFLLLAPKGRQRAAAWMAAPDLERPAAAGFMRMTYEIAERYRLALESTR
jgi:hypothetical protein